MGAIGGTIRALRLERQMTQQQLAEKLFVTRQTVSNWETGVSQPGLDQLDALAAALDTQPEALLGGRVPAAFRPGPARLAGAAVLGLLALAWPACEFCLVPRMEQLAAVTYDLRWMNLHTLGARPLLQLAAGAALCALFTLRFALRPGAGWRRGCRAAGLAAPLLWGYAALPALFPTLSRFTGLFRYAPAVSLRLFAPFSPVFLLAGAALFLGFAPGYSPQTNPGPEH